MADQSDPKKESAQADSPQARRSSKKALHVAAPIVTVRTTNDRIVYLYKGDVLPEDTPQESIDHLKSLGFVTEDDVPPVD